MDKVLKMKVALILAGGKGTRLSQIRSDIPKPMMPVLGKPILEYQINLLKEHEFTDVWLIVNHLYKHIEEYFGNGENFGINIHYFIEPKPLGTVGGVKALERHLKEPFLVLYGDVMMNMDLNRLIQFHHDKSASATLVVSVPPSTALNCNPSVALYLNSQKSFVSVLWFIKVWVLDKELILT